MSTSVNNSTARTTQASQTSAAISSVDTLLGQAGKDWKKIPSKVRAALVTKISSAGVMQGAFTAGFKAQQDLAKARQHKPGALSLTVALANSKKAIQGVAAAARSAALSLQKQGTTVATKAQVNTMVAVLNKTTNQSSQASTISFTGRGDLVQGYPPPVT